MSFFDRFRKTEPGTANKAKERLQIIVAHERMQRTAPDYLPAMQRDIIEVVRKYVAIEQDQVHINLSQEDNVSLLELNVSLPN